MGPGTPLGGCAAVGDGYKKASLPMGTGLSALTRGTQYYPGGKVLPPLGFLGSTTLAAR